MNFFLIILFYLILTACANSGFESKQQKIHNTFIEFISLLLQGNGEANYNSIK